MPSPRAVAGVTQALIPFARLQPREVLLITPLMSFVQQGQELQAGSLPAPGPALALRLLTPAPGWELSTVWGDPHSLLSSHVPASSSLWAQGTPKWDQSSPGHPWGTLSYH